MKIGEALIKSGLISPEQLDVALKAQEKTNERLGDIIIKMDFVACEQMAPFLAGYFHLPFVQLKDIYRNIDRGLVDLIPEEIARRFTIMPVEKENNKLTIAMYDPLDVIAVDTVKIKTGLKVVQAVALEKDIHESIEYCYRQTPRMEENIEEFIQSESLPEKQEEDSERLRIEAGDPPVVQYVNHLVIQAYNSGASDIHLQPKQNLVELRLRIDGILYNINPPPKTMIAAITTRIKILSKLDIAERRLPQDGRFKMTIGKSDLDLRVSCFPTIYGESITIRLLDNSSPLLGLNQLGFPDSDMEKYRRLLQYSYGLILVTGPTGSGKTTTLYVSMQEVHSPHKNIVTLEDPVEYRLGFIQQTQVNSAIGFTFARGLRSMLRQDPDIILVGEIRDKDTAEIAIHAALTGHLVFSTLHTNDAAGAIVRLIDMGVEPFLVTSALLGVLAQRLVRKVCSACRQEYSVPDDVLHRIGLTNNGSKYYRGTGCPKCMDSGYKGRLALSELMIPDESVRRLILSRASSEEIRHKAQENGMKTLRQNGLDKVKAGITTPEEVLQVTQESEEF